MKKIAYIDLGLPSGTLWASSNSEIRGKRHFTYDEAIKNFGEQIPTAVQFLELMHDCKWQWIELFGGKVKGFRVTGPNDSSIFLPASGFCDGHLLYDKASSGLYWSSRYFGRWTAYRLYFYSTDNWLDRTPRYFGLSIRTVKTSNTHENTQTTLTRI